MQTIKRWDTHKTVYAVPVHTFREAVQAAVDAGVSLYRADLRGAEGLDYSGADITQARFDEYAGAAHRRPEPVAVRDDTTLQDMQ